MTEEIEYRWVYFENSLLAASVQDEVRTLSQDGVIATLTRIKRVYEGKIDPNKLKTWREYRGIRLFLTERRGELMVYGTERQIEKGRRVMKISIMFAGVRRNGYTGLGVVWDGSDDSLWRDVVEPRCRYHFA